MHIPEVLDATACAELRGLFDRDDLFSKTVAMDREDFGRGVYRYFRPPIPPLVEVLRRVVYPHVARVANDWQGLLNESSRFPQEWVGYRDHCHEAGQAWSTPILLKYGPGGFNALHRDLRGPIFFPIQMAVVLTRAARRQRMVSTAAISCFAMYPKARNRAATPCPLAWATSCYFAPGIGWLPWVEPTDCSQ